jgi:hypothetical protein
LYLIDFLGAYLEAELGMLHPSVHVKVVTVHLPVLQHALSGTRLAHGLEAHVRQPDVSPPIVGCELINLQQSILVYTDALKQESGAGRQRLRC